METAKYSIEMVGTAACLWRYTEKASGRALEIAPPAFEVDGQLVVATVSEAQPVGEPQQVWPGVTEHVYGGAVADEPRLRLELVFRVADESPVVRFQYRLCCAERGALTKEVGRDNLRYLGLSLESWPDCREVRLGEFDESAHSYVPVERPVPAGFFEHGEALIGPLLLAGDDEAWILAAYEHGAQAPDTFVEYGLTPGRRVEMRAVKGNYWAGQPVDAGHPYETIWLELAVVPGSQDDLADAYRDFALRWLSPNAESRSPLIFYNTWCWQERNKWWHGAAYLDSMHQERMLAEIEVAHRMGVDVFVLDTGWYEKTGDWRVNEARFPGGLQEVRRRLEEYGMRLGLWFSPNLAAASSQAAREYTDCRMERDGQVPPPHPVWETEDSYNMCLASRYWEAYADEMIRLVREVGVTYFKWDAIGQYGCDAAGHAHGGPDNEAGERADCYAFEQVRYMVRIVDRVCAACPQAIVDFDITEGGRTVGLAFLAAGKYFLVNNGPYFTSLDHPYDRTETPDLWSNVLVYPGAARARVCRRPLEYDRWLPSVLFLTHYLPDDPRPSQEINLASLILGQNGIWGDLLTLSDEGVSLFGETLARYKQVADAITAAPPRRWGPSGGSPEVHEKIDPHTGRGAVALFANARGRYSWITQGPVADGDWAFPGVEVQRLAGGRARLEVHLEEAGGKVAFFGVE